MGIQASPTDAPRLRYKEAESSLPAELKPIFRRFVEEYEYLANIHHWTGYVAHQVLADVIRAGWRPSADALPGSRL
jgi:hypothetical protein